MIILALDKRPQAGDVFSGKAIFLEDSTYDPTSGCMEFALVVTESDEDQPFKVYSNLPLICEDEKSFEVSISRKTRNLINDLITPDTRILITRKDGDTEIFNHVIYPTSIEYHYVKPKDGVNGRHRLLRIKGIGEDGSDISLDLPFSDRVYTDKIRILKN